LAGLGFWSLNMGIVYLNQAKLEKAMDSAVLAGVQELPGNPQLAIQVAHDYAVQNGAPDAETVFSVDATNKIISGNSQKELGLFFARVLGFNTAHISAAAKARIAPISSTGGVVPFGVIEGSYTFGQMVRLKEGAGELPYPGWFGPLRLGGSGAHVYRDNIKYGYPEMISIGDVIPIEPGNMSGPTRVGIEYRINECCHTPPCTVYSYAEGCPRILIVPIIRIQNSDSEGHPSTVKVVSFGAFLVDHYVGNGIESNVWGSFINYVIPGQINENGSDSGVYVSQLFE
jgi:hypothetical protein